MSVESSIKELLVVSAAARPPEGGPEPARRGPGLGGLRLGAAALVADPSHPNCVFTTGRCVAGPTSWPAPSTRFQNIFQLADPDGTLRNVVPGAA